METRIRYGHELSAEDFESILALDRKFFGNEILTNEGLALKRFLKFKDSIISAYLGNVLMGFICFFSVESAVYKRAVFEQEYIDDNLCDSEVKPLTKGNGNYILMFDHVIDEPFRNQGISRLLVDSVRDYLKQKNDEGYIIDSVFGYAITPKGRRILSSYGGNELWTRDNITCLEINKEIFLRLL